MRRARRGKPVALFDAWLAFAGLVPRKRRRLTSNQAAALLAAWENFRR